VERIGEGLYTISLEHLDNRTMFLEMPDYVVAFEAPLDSPTGELLVETIEATTHQKPIRYLLVSHHHPDYVGGFRPFVARGVHVITTPGNVDYLDSLARAPRTLAPDALARAPVAPIIETVQKKRVIGEGARTIEIYDIGPYTGHTDEYLIYYLPFQRLLFEGDLIGMKPGPVSRAGKRAMGLLQAIDDLHLDVDQIHESWPLKDRAKMVPIGTLRQMVELRREQDRASAPH
jgi:glyoxylase-like metal-dependent hydrolase (beta-lactamase superfamily II)